jgi:hypothetical protein
MSRRPVKHRIIHVEDVVLVELELKTVADLADPVEHRLNVEAVAGLVLDLVVPFGCVLGDEGDLVGGSGELEGRLLGGGLPQVDAVVLEDAVAHVEAGLFREAARLDRVYENADPVAADEGYAQVRALPRLDEEVARLARRWRLAVATLVILCRTA